MLDTNKFCKLLSNGYSFSTNRSGSLLVGPCCLHTKKIPVDKNLVQTHRMQFGSITDWTDACRHCHVLESAGQQSLRQTGPDWIGSQIPSGSAVMIDINLDLECNAACVICGEHSSSLWAKENQKFFKIHDRPDRTDQKVDEHIDMILGTTPLDHVTYIKFFGGEPLFTDTHLKFLEKIPHKENVVVHYTTNGSIFPSDRTLEIWTGFKTIIFAASVDGIEDQFDYVRWPLSWEKVSRNLLRIQESNLHNLMFRIEFTANLLNTYYFDRLEGWIEQNLKTNQFGDPTEINIHPCTKNAFALEHMPTEVKKMIMQKYHPDHRLHKMVSNIRSYSNLDEFWRFVEQWDSKRNLNWQDCFPDLLSHIINK